MLDILSLERRWLKYKIKSYLPYIILSSATITLVIALTVKFTSKEEALKKIEPIKPPVAKKVAPKNLNEHNMILEPSMQFIQAMSPNIQPAQVSNISTKPLPPKVVSEPKAPVLISPAKSVAINPQAVTVSPPPSIIKPKSPTMKHDSNAFDIHEIEERFKVNSNPHLGLYIARYHYEHANYNEAYNYALKTNSINSTLEESWLIFAKSLIKLGKTDQAKKTLQLYISQSNSDNAKSLLYSIEQGGIK